MINFVRSILNDVFVSDNICKRYVFILHQTFESKEVSSDGITSFIIDGENNLYPNGILFGDDRLQISTEDINYTNDLICTSGLKINPYEHNKLFLYNRFIPFDNIINELKGKLNFLGYPQYLSLYRYNAHHIELVGTYTIIYDINEIDKLVTVYAYINEFDKLKISEYSNI